MTLQIRSVIFLRIVTIEKRNYCFPLYIRKRSFASLRMTGVTASLPVSGASVSEALRGRRGAGPYTTCGRPFLSYTGRGAFFLFGKAKRKNGGRITQAMSFAL